LKQPGDAKRGIAERCARGADRWKAQWAEHRGWVWSDVAIPFAVTRLALLLVGWFSQHLLPNKDYPLQSVVERGWHFSPYRLLDIWGRWDSGWYLDIVQRGYSLRGVAAEVQSNIAFYPLYPTLVRWLTLPIPDAFLTPGRYLLVGVALSNVLALAALVLLYRVVMSMCDQEVAGRTVAYVLLFPTGFFLSCFYTESAFLFLSVAAFYLAARRRWPLACLMGCCLALTRPQGILIAVPLVWMYLEGAGWSRKALRLDALWFLLVPVGLLVHLWTVYQLSGNALDALHIQTAWQRSLTTPWETVLRPAHVVPYILPLERWATLGFLSLSVAALWLLPSAAYGLFCLLSMAPILTSGTLTSAPRFVLVLFPAFVVLAMAGRRRVVHLLIVALSFALQVLLMAAWSQFYWVA
jgi:hypothetical protein